MRILVLGGTGLISTPIVRQLIEQGHEPILFNRSQSASRLDGPVQTIHGDRGDFRTFGALMADRSFDAVIDMITFDAKTAENAVQVFSGKTGQYVFCSTVCVYGKIDNIPATEDEPHKPTAKYGRDKSLAEAVFMRAHAGGRLPVTVMRPAHTYGPGAPFGDVWGRNPSLVPWLRTGKPTVVAGDGTTLWQPGYADDVARAFVHVLGRNRALGQAYNAVADDIMEWTDYFNRLAAALGCETRLLHLTTEQICAAAPTERTGGLREIFSIHNAFSNEKLKRDVPEFADLVAFEEGVRRTAAWMDAAAAHGDQDLPPWLGVLLQKAGIFLRELTP